ncbi:MAG: transketolase family protein [Candidatus Pacebacteria bacterium]|nr:transketolase family protein [Candidatus Paceibacterota bacterium]
MQNILNPKIFDTDVEQKAIRDGFGQGIIDAAEKNKNIVGLCADLTDSTKMGEFKKKFPERFLEIGIAEQNMASVASGMAAMGKLPFITSYAMFSPGRNWEQIRTTICYNDQKVIIAGSHAGISVGPDGGTHQAIEDIAITRVIPNMTVIVPCDAIEARKATQAVARSVAEGKQEGGQGGGTDTPVYLRLAREKSPVITTEETPFEIGKAQIFFELDESRFITMKSKTNGGSNTVTFKLDTETHDIRHDVGIIACGQLVYQALKIAHEYEEKGIAVKVMNLATIKPLDENAVLTLAKETRALVTVEEHQVAGGMGSTVAEYLSKNFPTHMEFVGVENKFGQSGTPAELIKHYGMGEEHIREAVAKVLKRKG